MSDESDLSRSTQSVEGDNASNHSPRLRAGQNVACRVLGEEPGGYVILLTKYDLPGFLPLNCKLSIGEEVVAQVVCFHNNRVLVSCRVKAPILRIVS